MHAVTEQLNSGVNLETCDDEPDEDDRSGPRRPLEAVQAVIN